MKKMRMNRHSTSHCCVYNHLRGMIPPPKSTLLGVATISLAGINTPKTTCTNKDNMAPRLSKD